MRDIPVRGTTFLRDGDTIGIGEGQYLRCHFSDGIIEEERNVINTVRVKDLSHVFDRRQTALDNISFSVQRGEMVCVMGPSGCGKSTLLKTIGGQLKPDFGRVELNGIELYEEHRNLTPYIAFIPHEDAFDPLLTVEENLDTAAAIRAPHLTRAERRRRVDAKLVELGLHEIRHRLAGDDQTKNLSGGQRKRLNAGMDMIGIADIYLFDEPTSGLSSKDSEHVLDIIRGPDPQQDHPRVHSPAQQSAVSHVRQGPAARQRRKARLLRHAGTDAGVFRRSSCPGGCHLSGLRTIGARRPRPRCLC